MSNARPTLNNLDDYERYVTAILERWSAVQRTAFAAAMAERWVHAYVAFAKREEWGDPDAVRRSIDAVWAHVGGRPLAARDRARHLTLLHDCTPHMDDFDEPEALAAVVMVREAVECCASADNVGAAYQAAISGFEAVVPDWSIEPEEQGRLWQRSLVRKEVEKQLALLERVDASAPFDQQTIAALRQDVTKAALAGAVPRKKKPAAPALRTNQDIFEQYRGIIELDTRTRRDVEIPGASVALQAMLWFTEWLGRYKRRKDLISGVYGQLADRVGQDALVQRQLAKDRAESTPPEWDTESREMVDQVLANPMLGVDVTDIDAPHSYGPSVRRLWAEAKRKGMTGDDAWRHVIAWARHRPASWDREDHRKRKGNALSMASLGDLLAREVTWTRTADPERPWSAVVEGSTWQVQLNDFPDEILYTLIVDGSAVGDFHDWPETWHRP